MRYRALSPTGDYQFGKPGIILRDTPAAVAQAVKTRLALWSGTWFLDLSEGTDYIGGVVGAHTQGTRDLIVKDRILGTFGVVALLDYSSSVSERRFTVVATVSTAYGAATITT
jgi:hypothetical protein